MHEVCSTGKSHEAENSDPKHAPNEPKFPLPDAVNKQEQREKAEVKEVAGHHKNDGPIGYKGRQ